jgi:hypothetical protein
MIVCLERGSLKRKTASTLMNNESSRSHAIYSITIEQHQIDDLYQVDEVDRKHEGGESGVGEDGLH